MMAAPKEENLTICDLWAGAQTTPSAFGQSASAFGATPFGVSSASSLFGQQSKPAFGQSAPFSFNQSSSAFGTPAFGQQSSASMFGSNPFGAKVGPLRVGLRAAAELSVRQA